MVEMSIPARSLPEAALKLDAAYKELGECAGILCALRLFFGEEDLKVGIAAAEISDQRSVAKDDARANTAGERG